MRVAIDRNFKWFALAAGGTTAIGAAILVRQMRRPPVANSFYVALGSSFAAGLGLGKRAPDSPWISQRSVNGYPQQLARMLNVPSLTDMTSSGSTVAQILNGGQMLLGPQINALGPDTQLVTLTAGGNDVKYVGDLIALAFGNRRGVLSKVVRRLNKEVRPVNERDFGAFETNLTATILEIRRRSPQAGIVIVTYPTILPALGTCSTLGVTADQATLMRSVADKLAQVTRDTVESVGATIVDMAVLSAGHDACSAEPWVNGFRPATGADFHPTLAGARATAQAILKIILPLRMKSGDLSGPSF